MKIKLLIEYDGTKFCGWQKQRSQISVQETAENAIKRVFSNSCEIELYGAGRTDAGVHALGQVAHFELNDEKLIEKWKDNLNKLPIAINAHMRDSGACVLFAEEALENFHARFSATMRYYKYVILNRKIDSPIYKSRVWNIYLKLDEKLMNTAAQFLVGYHNFNAFRSSKCSAPNPNRTVSSIKVFRENDFIVTEISAKSFLHNQIRIMVGVLKEIGLGKQNPEYIEYLLKSAERGDGATAPAFGLYFVRVDY
jgi:tRNA pseudouridine38-40 synthase